MGNDEPRTEENRSDPGVVGGLAAEAVHVFVFAGANELEPDNRLTVPDEIIAGPAAPRKIVREIVLVSAGAAQSELSVGLEEKRFGADGKLAAEDSVVRTRAESQVVTVNAALRRARNLHFVEFF